MGEVKLSSEEKSETDCVHELFSLLEGSSVGERVLFSFFFVTNLLSRKPNSLAAIPNST